MAEPVTSVAMALWLTVYAQAPKGSIWYSEICEGGGLAPILQYDGAGPTLDDSKIHFLRPVPDSLKAFVKAWTKQARECAANEHSKACGDVPEHPPCAPKCDGDACKPIS